MNVNFLRCRHIRTTKYKKVEEKTTNMPKSARPHRVVISNYVIKLTVVYLTQVCQIELIAILRKSRRHRHNS